MAFTIGKLLPPLTFTWPRIWAWLEQAFPWLPEAAEEAERKEQGATT